MAEKRRRASAGRRSGPGRRRTNKKEYFFDYSLLFIVLFLIIFGLVMIYSSSSYKANLDYGNPAYFFWKQFSASIFGLVVMMAVSFIDYHIWQRFAFLAYIGSAVLIALVMTPLGFARNGARRWLNLGISLQPAEVAKLGVIIFLATMICQMGKKARTWKGIGFLAGAAGIIAGMIMIITNNLSSAIIIIGIAAVMIFVSDYDYKKYVIAALLGTACVAGMIFYVLQTADSESGFRFKRIVAWLDPTAYSSDTAFQTLQALYAIGSGGIFGKGLGQSMQKLGYLPEAQNDMIFSIICEELGLFGALAVILLFVLLIWRCMVIANNAPDLFGALLTVGVMGHLAIQVILNIAVVTNSIPNTGISLPFISYGGSSVTFLLAEIGIVLNISRKIRLYDVG